MSRPKSRASDEWALVARALVRQGERLPTGKGWQTIGELAKAHNRTRGGFRKFLLDAVKAGLVDRFQGLAYSEESRCLKRTVWFRPKAGNRNS